MSRLLLVVEQAGEIKGRGVMLFPGVALQEGETLRAGDKLLLKLPEGKSREVEIAGLASPNPNPKKEVLLVLGKLKEADVPLGAEVWSIDSRA
jgi:hypothetical protein